MSPNALTHRKARQCFPRVSGDEPGAKAVMAVMDRFSPREWG